MIREEQIYKKAEGDCIAMLESIERGDIIKGSICPQSYRAGFMDGAKWAGSHPQWIPVEEELPKRMKENSRFSDTVLVYNKDGYKDTAYYDYEEEIWRWMPKVTHWMPIVPPQGKEG